jgi:hypothetical protein
MEQSPFSDADGRLSKEEIPRLSLSEVELQTIVSIKIERRPTALHEYQNILPTFFQDIWNLKSQPGIRSILVF